MARHPRLPPREVEGESFAWALMRLMDGQKVQRMWWEGTWVGLQEPDEQTLLSYPYLYKRLPNAKLAHWTPSDEDLLSVDWCDLTRWVV